MKRISLWFLRSEGKGVGLEVEEVDSSRKYDVYGLVRSGQLGSSSQKYVGGLGHESDGSTGLIYMRARYMDPVLGRFISEDPSKDGVNWFVYCGDEPVNLCDKDGKKPLPNSDWFFLGIIFATFAVFEACLGLTDIPDGGDFVYPVSFRWAVILGNCSVGFFARALVGLDIDPAIQAKLANVAITMGIFEGVTFF
jgi:RHS repeat-associated protein